MIHFMLRPIFFSCHTTPNFKTAIVRILPNYIATYVPITIVMIANPILYRSSSKDMERLLTSTLGQLTRRERDVMDTIKIKFSLINVVFYICWIPNLINGILLWSLWFHLPIKITIAIWYIMVREKKNRVNILNMEYFPGFHQPITSVLQLFRI